MAHHVAPDKSIYADTGFLNGLYKMPGVEVHHMGFGEFYITTPKGRVEVDRMRGKEFPGMSGRPHLLYDEDGGKAATEWLVKEVEADKRSDRLADLRDRTIRLAASDEALRPHLLAALREAASGYTLSVGPDGGPTVDGYYDPILFAMIVTKILGVPVGGQGVSNRYALVDGVSMPWGEALAKARKRAPELFSDAGLKDGVRVKVKVDSIYEKSASSNRTALSEVGRTILDQMGGARRVMLMLGIGKSPNSYFYDLPGGKGVGFLWPNKERARGNNVEIELLPSDTYEVRFFNTTVAGKKPVKSFTDVYNDSLVDVFEGQTGWRLRL